MKKTRILIGVIILIIIIFGFYNVFLKKENEKYNLFIVRRGNISQEVSETGTVKKGEEVNFSFKSAGKIEKINVKAGDKLEIGKELAKLETTQLSLKIAEAQANLEVNQAQLNKLLAGASAEDIKLAETAVLTAKQNLEDTKETAQEKLNNDYGDALNVLEDAYLRADTAFKIVQVVQLTYFTRSDQEGFDVRDNKDRIETNLNKIKTSLDRVKANFKEENMDSAFGEFKKYLGNISNALTIIRQSCEETSYQNTVSSADKTSLDTRRADINTALTNVTNSQQTISLTKVTNQSNINTAENSLKKAEDELAKLKAPARPEDVDLYQAKVKEAKAQLNLLQRELQEATLVSLSPGQITKINQREGEVVQVGQAVLSFLPTNPFQIEADIYEEDIIKVKLGDAVDIKLTAWPDKAIKGKVVAIDPAEKLIEEVVYYEVNIDFEELMPELKPGMTADIIIKTDFKENVIIVPNSAIEEKGSKKTVQVQKNNSFREQAIEIGLKGADDMVEVVSGLKEGDKIKE